MKPFEQAIRACAEFIQAVRQAGSLPEGALEIFLGGAQHVYDILAKNRPKTTLLSITLVRMAYAEMLRGGVEPGRIVLLAALGVSSKAVQQSLAAWTEQEMWDVVNEIKKKGHGQKLPPFPQMPGIPAEITAAINEAIQKVDPETLDGPVIIKTPAGNVQIQKLDETDMSMKLQFKGSTKGKAKLNFEGDPARN